MQQIVYAGAAIGVDPRVYLAIANAESTLFSAPNAIAKNNPFGLKIPGGLINFTSGVQTAIASASATIIRVINNGNNVGRNGASLGWFYSGSPGAWCVGPCSQGLFNATDTMLALGGNPSSFGSLPSNILGVPCEW